MSRLSTLLGFLLAFHFSLHSFAQILPKEDAANTNTGLEDLYDKFDEDEETKATQKKKAKAKAEQEENENQNVELKRLSELVTLSPFENIAVIQKRFLPKSGRFELSAAGTMTTNNAFFNILGLALRAGYHINEKHSVEGTYTYLSSSERPITTGLVDNQSIKTESLVEPESYMGLAYKWAPVYGKMAWFQETIIPYDIYFTGGLGVTTTVVGGSEPTLSLGLGQLFAINKSNGVRWDFVWNNYSAEVEVDGVKETQSHNDIVLSIGWSFFFPEATYR